MPEHPIFLARSAERALAAAVIETAGDVDPRTTQVVADALDLASSAILTAAGVPDRDAARAVLSTLWARDV